MLLAQAPTRAKDLAAASALLIWRFECPTSSMPVAETSTPK